MISIKTKFIIVLTLLIVLVTVAVTTVRIFQFRNASESQAHERLKSNAALVSAITGVTRDYTEAILEGIAALPQVREAIISPNRTLPIHESEAANNTLAALFGNFYERGLYDNFLVFDAQFNLVASARYISVMPSLQENFQHAQEGHTKVSNVIVRPGTNQSHIWFTKPIMENGVFLGMVAIPLNTMALSSILNREIDAGYFTNIADGAGYIFYSDRDSYIGRSTWDLGVEEVFGYVPINVAFNHNSWITGVDKIAYVNINPYFGWTVVSFLDAHTVEIAWLELFVSMIPSLIGIYVGSIALFFIVSRALRPLKSLAEAAKQVAQGNMQVNFNVSRNDEIGQVSRSFMDILQRFTALTNNFKEAEHAVRRGDMLYRLEDSDLPGAYNEILSGANSILDEFVGILNVIAEPLIIVDQRMKVLFANRTIIELTNMTGQSPRGLHVNDFLKGDVVNNPAMLKCFREGQLASCEIQLPLNPKKTFDFYFNAIPIKDTFGNSVGAFLLLADITPIRDTGRVSDKLSKYRQERTEKLTNDIVAAFSEGNLTLDISSSPYDNDTQEIAQEFDRIEGILQQSTNTIKGYIDELQFVLESMSKKDFNKKIEQWYMGDFFSIKDSVNMILDNMNNFFAELSASSLYVKQGAGIIADTAQSMVNNFNEQYNATTEINLSMNRITKDINQNVDNAQEATRLSALSQEAARQGNAQMADMQTAMNEIRESSGTVAGIIKTVESIAFQTKLLALNAAIEAARAGKHGKGFAVVAEEVRGLASRSAEAAKESATMIEASMEKVDMGVAIAGTTAKSFTQIADTITSIGKVIDDISISSASQAQAIENIEGIIKRISDMAQSNTAVVNQNAATTEELTSQAEVLRSMIAEFKLR